MLDSNLNFNQRVRMGFLATLFSALLIGALSILVVRSLSRLSSEVVFNDAQSMVLVEKLRIESEKEVAANRGFLIAGDEVLIEKISNSKRAADELIRKLKENDRGSEALRFVSEIEAAREKYALVAQDLLKMRSGKDSFASLVKQFEAELHPKREFLEAKLQAYAAHKEKLFEQGKSELTSAMNFQLKALIVISVLALFLASVIALVLGKTLMRLFEDSERATRLREEVVAIVAHDLRNPLAALNANVFLLKRMFSKKVQPDLADVNLALQASQSSVEQMNQLIENILDVTRVESGKLAIDCAPIAVDRLLIDMITQFAPLAVENGVHLEASETESQSWIWGDYQKITQVFSNLIGNAMKFSPSGGRVHLSAETKKNLIEFCVADTGAGISAERLPHVFDRFWQGGENAKRGLGLGLSIVKGIIEAHGGRVWVKSIHGKGAQFYFSIARCDALGLPLMAS